jgi:hypothetical protein
MTTTKQNPAPSVAEPVGAQEVSEWIDLDHPYEAHRLFRGPRRGVDRYYVGDSPVGPNYVEAHGLQEFDGRLTDVCVRAQIDVWDLGHHEYWDDMLTPDEARSKASELRSQATNLTQLAEAFEAAADEVDGWAAR